MTTLFFQLFRQKIYESPLAPPSLILPIESINMLCWLHLQNFSRIQPILSYHPDLSHYQLYPELLKKSLNWPPCFLSCPSRVHSILTRAIKYLKDKGLPLTLHWEFHAPSPLFPWLFVTHNTHYHIIYYIFSLHILFIFCCFQQEPHLHYSRDFVCFSIIVNTVSITLPITE